uniref:Uncharacterized protein n=1 Tax=Romanomermis culicivorax TaxID=13658 RepID=A0A915KGU3_ROMCU
MNYENKLILENYVEKFWYYSKNLKTNYVDVYDMALKRIQNPKFFDNFVAHFEKSQFVDENIDGHGFRSPQSAGTLVEAKLTRRSRPAFQRLGRRRLGAFQNTGSVSRGGQRFVDAFGGLHRIDQLQSLYNKLLSKLRMIKTNFKFNGCRHWLRIFLVSELN